MSELVLVESVNLEQMSSVVVVSGTAEDGRTTVVFAGDWRPMAALAEYIEENGPTECEVERWQVLERSPA